MDREDLPQGSRMHYGPEREPGMGRQEAWVVVDSATDPLV